MLPAESERALPRPVLTVVTRQLATLMAGSVDICRALEGLSRQGDSPEMQEALGQLARSVGGGSSLSWALTQQGKRFPPIFVTMIKIGEETGSLHKMLSELALWLERDHLLRQKLRSALTYPLLILAFCALMTLGLFYGIMPGFVPVLEGLHVPLPWTTQLLLWLTAAIRSPGFWIWAASCAWLIWRWGSYYASSLQRRAQLAELLARIPGLGGVFRSGCFSLYCSAFATMLSNGLPLPRCVKLSAAACRDPRLELESAALLHSLTQGGTLSGHMRGNHLYPACLVHMVAAGEESSRLPEMFSRLAAVYSEDLAIRVEMLGAALEPLLLLLVATLVGTILLSVFLPLYSYVNQI